MTNNEREEYRLAALAAGYQYKYGYDDNFTEHVIMEDGVFPIGWNPKIDKADSFDLMAACRMDLFLSSGSVRASNGESVSGIYQSDKPIDEQAMEVIFMRAVSIGRSIEERK
jgi:hypothetical protein